MDVPCLSSQINEPSSAFPFDLNNSPSEHTLDIDAISDHGENSIPTQEQQGIVRGYGKRITIRKVATIVLVFEPPFFI
ncbi:hypothetical protein LINPERPRIM_LOCUS249 [Linum perenne]